MLAAALREIGEETNFQPEAAAATPVWEGDFAGEDAWGQPITRHVGLFRIAVSSAFDLSLTRKEGRHAGTTPQGNRGTGGVDSPVRVHPFARKAIFTIVGRESDILE